ncbi:hypothetical protein [Thalassoroseus pseudoceratinae]|uniref:hypothetical protein n=1 Tax=Thalassoroseus pseudoceratinae TaxID=2713176 RepID=UPI00141E9B81|nr:hypothetical protein [Thalassoroseus pseudoceratinae]
MLEENTADVYGEPNSGARPMTIRIPGESPSTTWARVRAADLLDQQFWCWGD